MSDNENSRQFRQAAVDIGQRIIRSSIWHGDRCNWLGAESTRRGGTGEENGFTYAALGPELYSGTSGVALFLAELAAVTEDAEVRMTALGAIRQSLSRMDAVPPNARLGLFSGWSGIMLAAVRVGMLLDAPDLREQALNTLGRFPSEVCDSDEFDLMAGKAGGIAALLVLHGLLQEDASFDLAVRLGDQLIDGAEKTAAGWSWKSPGFQNDRNLTGLSHGTAGSGYALLELFAATQEERFLKAAEQAFHYERTWFSEKDMNWPDFRRDPDSRTKQKRLRRCLSFWCHGAPGIALSRVRAFELLESEKYREEAEIALETTAASLRSAVDGWTGNFSLCHGLAGNGDVILCADETLGKNSDGWHLSNRVAQYGIERYGDGKEEWPCGTHSGEAPGLMLGLAGIGHFYLRLCQHSTPSILLLRGSEWQRSGG
jgi:lantibiotic modifying enzyme